MRSNGTVKMKMSSGKDLSGKILYERAQIYKRLSNMVRNKIKKYRRKFRVRGKITLIPHNDLAIFHETGFPLLKVSFLPLGGIPERYSVFSYDKGTEYSDDLKANSLEIAFEKLLQT